ncbi:non-ribosomal peptide synthetase [Micromonospora chokoriensis]|uniref:non-ribosomal peptide synthetase n=1 Tax=Micromonospora chokoriensis TaxID=356851 RepID=UPI000A05D768|nr:non-ribosomal peptide synthetase [Micromonospora chokoriensis]
MPSTNSPDQVSTLTGLFAANVVRHPQRPAVSDDEQTLTYAELNGRADQLAAQLRARGVRAQDRVGLYLDRSVDVLVAILGILKAGGAYVAVDTRYPDARRDHMLSSSDPRLVVTRPEWEDRLAHLDLDVVGFRSAAAADPGPEAEPRVRVEPEWAASILFTSGSSGQPKGIVLEHRNICSFATNPSLPALTPEDRTGQISSLSFDAFHFEMWSTLAHGAEVVILPPVPDLLAADFRREMKRRRITAMLVPTMVINQVVREDRDAFASLRILQAGGDVLLPAACRELLDGDFRGELYNLYGPAEITTACTLQRVTKAEAELDSVPIGRPLAGVTVHVLTPEMCPAAPGQIGEIHVGGPGVARGYLGQPELTAERFVPSPFPDGATPLYRTGDLARWNPDGVLEFVGRADDQLKIRGYRVEPGEVERALTRHRDVQEVAVLASGSGDNKHLVAFVVLGGTLTAKRLREYAEAEMPDFMVPSHLVQLSEIPSNDHGKRDPVALQRLLEEHRGRQDRYVAPTTGTESYLAALWEELLGIESVSGNDDFFSLGGHSLLAFRMNSRIKREFAVPVEYSVILRNSVLADLAARIDELKKGGALL